MSRITSRLQIPMTSSRRRSWCSLLAVVLGLIISSCSSAPRAEQIPRLTPQEALAKVERNEALLVCPYEKAACTGTHLVGSIALESLESSLPKLTASQEIIFFCGCPKESFAASRATEFAARGFRNVAVIDGGILGWIHAGYAVMSTAAEHEK